MSSLADRLNAFVLEIQQDLAGMDIDLSPSAQALGKDNTLAVLHNVLGVVSPRNVEQTQKVVVAANRHQIPLYPISRGKNLGYGQMTPYKPNQVVLNLKYLSTIREYDPRFGEVVIETGVTQKQLAEFLKQKSAPFWLDVTGASPEASVVGNAIEGGFGHTPLGDHRKHILDMEVIFSDGTLLTTGEMPSIGPDLAQLFVQSNFAIVTAIRIPLFPIPPKTLTYLLLFSTQADFFKGLSILVDFRTKGLLNSLVHVANATRSYLTSQYTKRTGPDVPINEEQCLEIVNRKNFIRIGSWAACGAIYGYPAELDEKARVLKKAFKGFAKIKFFSDADILRLDKLLNWEFLKRFAWIQRIKRSFTTIKALHGLLRGEPSNEPTENLFAGMAAADHEKFGLAWFGPVLPATVEDVRTVLGTARTIFDKYEFLMPVTLTLMTHKKMVALFSISFDRSSPLDIQRAHDAYHELVAAVQAKGYYPYRLGILSHFDATITVQKADILSMLKKTFDPNNVIAPGRYNRI